MTEDELLQKTKYSVSQHLLESVTQQLSRVLTHHNGVTHFSIHQPNVSYDAKAQSALEKKAIQHNITLKYQQNIGIIFISGDKNNVLDFLKSATQYKNIIF